MAMDPWKIIDRYLHETTDLEKTDISRARLSADMVKIGFETRRFWISVVGMVLTLCGLGIGVFQYLSNQRAQLEAQNAQFKSQIALKFFTLKQDQKPPYIQNLEAFGDFDQAFIAKLKNGLVDLPDEPDVAIDEAQPGAPNSQEIVAQISAKLPDLLKIKTKPRRQARTDLAELFALCSSADCVSFIDSTLSVENLTTSERYRLALGIVTALSRQQTGHLKLMFDGYPNKQQLIGKIEKLAKLNEPAISGSANRVLNKLNVGQQ